MPVSADIARKLCSASELKLFDAASRKGLKAHNALSLQPLIARARKLRDKWRVEVKRQLRADKEKLANAAARLSKAGRKVADKAALFGETLKRFERRLHRLQTPKIVVSRGTKVSGAPKWLRHHIPVESAAIVPATHANWTPQNLSQPEKLPRDAAAVVAQAGGNRVLAHMASRNRRSQARRDNRQG